jgi:TPP-dependent pyruvate/acetoin dehydrogenase alpha subunit
MGGRPRRVDALDRPRVRGCRHHRDRRRRDPIASGLAYAGRLADPVRVAVAFLGDGAASIGAFHEGISMARVWGLPAIFVVEQPLPVATTVEKPSASPTSCFAPPAGHARARRRRHGHARDAEAVRQACSHAAAGNGPVLIEAKTYRYRHQNGKLPEAPTGTARRTRRPSGARDPLASLARDLNEGCLTAEQIEQVRTLAADLVAGAANWCTVERDGVRAIRPERQPSPADADVGVRGDL